MFNIVQGFVEDRKAVPFMLKFKKNKNPNNYSKILDENIDFIVFISEKEKIYSNIDEFIKEYGDEFYLDNDKYKEDISTSISKTVIDLLNSK